MDSNQTCHLLKQRLSCKYPEIKAEVLFSRVYREETKKETYREESVDDVCLYGAERFVFDHNEDLFLLLQVDEVTKP